MKIVYKDHPLGKEEWSLEAVGLYIEVKIKGKCNLGNQEMVQVQVNWPLIFEKQITVSKWYTLSKKISCIIILWVK